MKINEKINQRVKVLALDMIEKNMSVSPLGGEPFGELLISVTKSDQDVPENGIPMNFPNEPKLQDYNVCILGPAD